MSVEENKAIVRRLYGELYQKRNTAILDELLAPDYVLRFAADVWQPSVTRGPAVYREFMKVWWEAIPDFAVTIEQMLGEDDRVVTVCTWSGTHRGDLAYGPAGPIRPTGRRLNLPDIIVSRISEGQIVEEWESANMGSVWQQLGAIPSPQS
jgi:predicted ester cyclase